MPLTLKSFTPLSQDRIDQIIQNARPELVSQVAFMARQAMSKIPEYVDLINGYKIAADKKSYIENNQQKIAEFLNDCGLMGYGNERTELSHGNFIIGAEGMELIVAYLKDKKGLNQRLCDVVVVKNNSFEAPDGSRKHVNIFLQKDQIHSDFAVRLTDDLRLAGDGVMQKIYVIEPFGTTGGGHAICVAVRKNHGEEAPLVHLFDPSPALLRNGLEAAQNSIANGWCSQLIVAATVKKVLEENGLRFDSEKYFNNTEPLQHAGYGYCRIIACDAANRFSNMTREQHEALLDSYSYKSPFGGMTEVGSKNTVGEIEPINLERVRLEGGYVQNPVFGLRGDEVVVSQFVDPALSSRVEELSETIHYRKDGREPETEADHVRRYQTEEGERQGFNTMLEEKGLRQKNHLFEIVVNDHFLGRAGDVGLAPNPFVGKAPFFPESNEDEKPNVAGSEEVVNAINNKLPRTNKINCASFDGSILQVSFYLGETTAEKVTGFFDRNQIGVEVMQHCFDYNLPDDVDSSLTRINECVVVIPRGRFEDIKLALLRAEQFYQSNPDHLFHPKSSAAVLGAGVNQLAYDWKRNQNQNS